ncbi:hypothetical protein WA026_008779 [Henosepilachna vigintioctopunctata]|uniref:Uncharacterized protein n=1 Tax=Henosepilachna vigintioctopunctata TaxID=420089 RepID=A0AAW1VC77_9CUCU
MGKTDYIIVPLADIELNPGKLTSICKTMGKEKMFSEDISNIAITRGTVNHIIVPLDSIELKPGKLTGICETMGTENIFLEDISNKDNNKRDNELYNCLSG